MHIVRSILAGAAVSVLLIGCSTGASPTAPASEAPASVAPTEAPASVAPTEAPPSVAPSAAAGATVEAKPVGTIGTVLVANGMTVYNFTKDVKDSGTSACTGGCITTWPAVTVADRRDPGRRRRRHRQARDDRRRDDGTVQVTYNGLPLYFFTERPGARRCQWRL